MTLDFKSLDEYFQSINTPKKEWIGLTKDDYELIYSSVEGLSGLPFWIALIQRAELLLKERNENV